MYEPPQNIELEASFEGEDLVASLDSKARHAVHDALIRHGNKHHIKYFTPTIDIGLGQYENEDPYVPREGIENSFRILRVRKDDDSSGGKLALFRFNDIKPKVQKEVMETLLEGRIKLTIKDSTQAEVSRQP